MTLNIKMIGMWLFAACMLILFAGCDGKDEGTDRESRAMLVAETVNYSTTTNSITTEGARGVTFRAVISAEEDAAWCSFALTEPLTETGGEAGSPVFIYLQKNGTDEDRTARIDMTFSDGYAVRLEMTQRSAGSTIVYDYERSWAEQPVLREDADFIYKTYYTTLATTEYATGGYRRNYSICYDRAKHVSRWVAYPVHYCYTTPSFERTNDWAFDPNDQLPEIPREDQQYILKGYGSYGYDRGHMLASATRYNTRATNAMTFYATNMMPQSSRFNQGIWATLEGKERDWGPERKKIGGKYLNYDTLYLCGDGYGVPHGQDDRQPERPDRRAVALLEGDAAPAWQREPADFGLLGRRAEGRRIPLHERQRRRRHLAPRSGLHGRRDREADGIHVLPQPRPRRGPGGERQL